MKTLFNSIKQIMLLIYYVITTKMEGYLFVIGSKVEYSQMDSINPDITFKLVVKPSHIPKTIMGLTKYVRNILKKIKENNEPKKEQEEVLELKIDSYHIDAMKNDYFQTFCGYVGIPSMHPYFHKTEDDDVILNLECHGGITFAGNDLSFMKKTHWYFGFDCAHGFDFIPVLSDSLEKLLEDIKDSKTYKDSGYAMEQSLSLYNQLNAARN